MTGSITTKSRKFNLHLASPIDFILQNLLALHFCQRQSIRLLATPPSSQAAPTLHFERLEVPFVYRANLDLLLRLAPIESHAEVQFVDRR
jgi:hypothetical protein